MRPNFGKKIYFLLNNIKKISSYIFYQKYLKRDLSYLVQASLDLRTPICLSYIEQCLIRKICIHSKTTVIDYHLKNFILCTFLILNYRVFGLIVSWGPWPM